MNKLGNVGKVILVGVVAAAFIIIVVIYGMSGSSNNSDAPAGSTTGTAGSGAAVTANSPMQTPTVVAQTGQTTGQMDAANQPAKSKAPSPKIITIITPVQGDVWTIGTDNLISWNQAGGISGDIYLADAQTGAFVGVILPQIGPQQTSYTWNTRDLLLDRTNPLKKDVTPGNYVLKIAYDGNDVPLATSPAFTITN